MTKSATFFSSGAGKVVAFTDSSLPSVTAVKVSGFEGFTSTRSIITRVGFSKQANVQFRHTVGGAVHIYTFGDRIGEAVISGLCFDNGCTENEFSGLEKMVDYYHRNRVSERGNPITITLGARLGLLAYLISVTCDIAETTSRVYQYTLKLVLVPEPARFGAGQGNRPAVTGQGGRVPVSPAMVAAQQQINAALVSGSAGANASNISTGYGSQYQTPGWGSTPANDIGGAYASSRPLPYPPTPGFVNYGTGPNTQLARGYN